MAHTYGGLLCLGERKHWLLNSNSMFSGLVYIAVLNYNTYEKSKVCINSCLKQEGINYRVILVDNNSSDDSFNQLKNDFSERIDYYQTGSNFGYAKGNNIAVSYCLEHGAKYTLLLNSDTEIIGNTLLKDVVEIAENTNNCAVVSPTIFDVTREGNKIHTNDSSYLRSLRSIRVLPQNYKINDNFETVSEAHGSALLVNNDIFLKVSGFPEHYFMYTEECTFSKRIIWAGYVICWQKSKNSYILHHHDKSKKTDGWRLFLMGRNRSLEYYENRKGKPNLWWCVYKLLKFKMLLKGMKEGKPYYYNGMKRGELIFKKRYTPDLCYEDGRKSLFTIK